MVRQAPGFAQGYAETSPGFVKNTPRRAPCPNFSWVP